MRRRSPRSDLHVRARGAWLVLGAAIALITSVAPASAGGLFGSSVAAAQSHASGALTTGLLVLSGPADGGRRALGGGLAVDLWRSFGTLRLGMYTGLQMVGGTDAQALVFTPIASSLAVVLDSERTSFEVRIRAGGYAGAVHERTFVGGLYLGTGVFLDFALSEHAAIGIGGELHLLIGSNNSNTVDSRAFFSPSVTLVYRPARTRRAP